MRQTGGSYLIFSTSLKNRCSYSAGISMLVLTLCLSNFILSLRASGSNIAFVTYEFAVKGPPPPPSTTTSIRFPISAPSWKPGQPQPGWRVLLATTDINSFPECRISLPFLPPTLQTLHLLRWYRPTFGYLDPGYLIQYLHHSSAITSTTSQSKGKYLVKSHRLTHVIPCITPFPCRRF